MTFGKYSKAIVAVVGGAVAVLTYFYGADNNATWLPILVNLLTAMGVYQVRNTGSK